MWFFRHFFAPYLFHRSRNNRRDKLRSMFWREKMFRKPHLKLLRWFSVHGTNKISISCVTRDHKVGLNRFSLLAFFTILSVFLFITFFSILFTILYLAVKSSVSCTRSILFCSVLRSSFLLSQHWQKQWMSEREKRRKENAAEESALCWNGTKSLRIGLPFTRCWHENRLKTIWNENGMLVGMKRKLNPSCCRVNTPYR